MKRIPQIDLLKGLAIISVILLHSWNSQILLLIGAPFTIWQAVPVFIIIAGYTNTLSYLRNGVMKLHKCYEFPILFHRFKRILRPFIYIFIVELILLYYLSSRNFDVKSIIFLFLEGGIGPGSYFVPIIIQNILIIPILYYLALRNPNYMLILAFALSLAFEILLIMLEVPEWLYRLLYVRYLFAGALGVYMATSKQQSRLWLIIGSSISFIYILLVSYHDFQFWFIYPAWGGQHAPSYIWTLVLVIAGLKLLPPNFSEKNILAELGKSSWHIFLLQLLYFSGPGKIVRIIVFSINNITCCYILYALVNLVLCLCGGYLFYRLDAKYKITSCISLMPRFSKRG